MHEQGLFCLKMQFFYMLVTPGIYLNTQIYMQTTYAHAKNGKIPRFVKRPV